MAEKSNPQFRVAHNQVGAFKKDQVFSQEQMKEIHPDVDLARLLDLGAIVPAGQDEKTTPANVGPENRPEQRKTGTSEVKPVVTNSSGTAEVKATVTKPVEVVKSEAVKTDEKK